MKRKTNTLEELLADLGREYQKTALPRDLEGKLREASSDLRAARKRKVAITRVWVWSVGSALAAMLLIGIAFLATQKKVSLEAVVDRPYTPPGELNGSRQPEPTASQAVHRRYSPSSTKFSRRPRESEAGVVASGFLALPGSEALPPPSEVSIVRVQMTKGDLRKYGFEVPPAVVAEVIHADFFLGEDGLPRAIRLVQ